MVKSLSPFYKSSIKATDVTNVYKKCQFQVKLKWILANTHQSEQPIKKNGGKIMQNYITTAPKNSENFTRTKKWIVQHVTDRTVENNGMNTRKQTNTRKTR